MSLRTLLGLDKGLVRLSTKEIVEVKPLTLRQCVLVERFYEPLAIGFAQTELGDVATQERYLDELFAIAAVATGKPVEFFETLSWEDWQLVIARILTVNANFFANLTQNARLRFQKQSETERAAGREPSYG